jgi:multiple sugar transport system substrate-binding protein
MEEDRMTKYQTSRAVGRGLTAAVMATTLMSSTVLAQSVDVSKWSPEYVRSIAGTETYDTVGNCNAITPTDYKGKVTFWYQGVFEADPQIMRDNYADFFANFRKTYPNIELVEQGITYNELLDKFRTALLGNAAPQVIRLQILGGTEFAAKGYLEELRPEDVGYKTEDFWPGAMKAVTWEGKVYGIPTNNETMAFIWNADLFEKAGLDPNAPPATWDDVVAYSKQIKDKVGVAGYGLVAKQNAGNTPYRFMPQLWAYGGGVFDEADANPTYDEIRLDSDASKRALQASYDMYVRDKSVPTSALTNTQGENQAPFISGQLAMMISHPSEYARMIELASQATGADKEAADKVLENMRYGLIPTGPDGKRAVVFGGSNIHIVKPEYVEGGMVDEPAAKALICMYTSPEWSLKLAWAASNPGHLGGFKTEWMKQRLDTIKFLDVTTSMLPNGIPFPALPEAPEIMNIIIPDMMQNALTGTMTVEEATKDAAEKVRNLRGGGL